MKLNEAWENKFEPYDEIVEWLESQEDKDGLKIVKKLIRENKFEEASWIIVTMMNRKQYLAYAIYAAERVMHIYEKEYHDKNPRHAIVAMKKVLKKDTQKNRELIGAAWVACKNSKKEAYEKAYRIGSSDAIKAAALAVSCVMDAARAAKAIRKSAWNYARYAAWNAVEAATWDAFAVDTIKATMQKKILKYGIKLLEEE